MIWKCVDFAQKILNAFQRLDGKMLCVKGRETIMTLLNT